MMNEPFVPNSQIPISESKRKSTDVICTIIGALIALTLFILACIFYNSAAINKAYFSFTAASVEENNYYGFQSVFWATVITSLGLGLLWLSFVHIFPRIAPHAAHVLAVLTLIALGVLTLVAFNDNFNFGSTWKYIIAGISFALAIIIFCMFWFYSNELRLQGIFLDYARTFLHDCTGTFAYIPLFLVLMAAFVALIVFQHLAFSSKNNKNNDYWDFTNPGVLGILNILEFIWGFQFLRDAFNFVVSGRACDWYWNNPEAKWYTPLYRLLTRHWGSVVGGSFVNAFFEIPTLFVQLFMCHAGTCCNGIGSKCDQKCCCGYCFDLVRTDAYSYITLTSNDFCNSARECRNLCFNGDQFVGTYNPMKHYRFAASVFLVALGYLLASIFTGKHVTSFTWWHHVILIITVYAVVCWFVDIDADAAEGISTSFFAERSRSKDYQSMAQALQPFKQEIQERANRDIATKDGQC